MILGKFKNGSETIMLSGDNIFVDDKQVNLTNYLKQLSIPSPSEDAAMDNLNNEISALTEQINQLQQSNAAYQKQIDYLLSQITPQEKETSPWVFYDWSNIPEALIPTVLNAHYSGQIDIADYWKVGDVRIYTDSVSHDTMWVTIADFNRDTLETPINSRTKAALTLICSTNHAITSGSSGHRYTGYGFWLFWPGNTPLISTDSLFLNFLSNYDTFSLSTLMQPVVKKDLRWRSYTVYDMEDTVYTVRYPALWEISDYGLVHQNIYDEKAYVNKLKDDLTLDILGEEARRYKLFDPSLNLDPNKTYIFWQKYQYEDEGAVLRLFYGGTPGSTPVAQFPEYFDYVETYTWQGNTPMYSYGDSSMRLDNTRFQIWNHVVLINL